MRAVYGEVEQSLRSEHENGSRQAADQLRAFLNSMPPIETERTVFKRKLEATLRAVQDKQPSVQHQPEAPSQDRTRGRER